MERAAIMAAVIEELNETLCDSDLVITEDMTLNSLGLDSLDVMQVVFELEDKLDVFVRDDEVLLNMTVGEVTDLLAAKKEKQCRVK